MKALFLLLSLFISLRFSAQVFTNAMQIETLSGMRLLVDSKGSVYAVGYDSKQNLPGSGGTGTMSVKIQKYDPASGDLLWQRTVSTPEYLNLGGAGMYNDQVLMGGAFRDKICSGTLCAVSNGFEDLFLVTVSEAGIVSMHTEGTTGSEHVFGFTVDNVGNTYFAGGCSGNVSLGTRTYSAKGDRDPFLMKKDKNLTEVYTLFGAPIHTSGTAYAPAVHNGSLYVWFTGWSVMEGSADSIGGGGGGGQLYRLEPDLVNYTSITPISSHMFSHRELQFAEADGSFYYTSMFSYKTSGQSIVKADNEMKTVWSYSVPAGSVTNLHFRNSRYYYASIGTHPQTGENIFYIREGQPGAPQSSPVCGVHMYFSGNYIYGQALQAYGDDMLLSGRFTGNLQLENKLLQSNAEKGSFLTIVRLGALTSLAESTTRSTKYYPNPAAGVVHITTENEEKYFSLTDLSGRMVLSGKGTSSNELALDVSGLQPGIYFLQLSHKGSTKTHKLIIER